MLSIKNLSVTISDAAILHECCLEIQLGSVHVLVGPNGSGKSSLALSLMGHPAYNVTSGDVIFDGSNIVSLATHIKVQRGMFLALQNTVEISGLRVLHFLKEISAISNKSSESMAQFMERVRPLLDIVGLSESILSRSVNAGFSGGEKKRFELLQMLILKPKLAILDEIDSGVDVDGLKMIASSLAWYKEQNPSASFLIVTHYRRIVDYLSIDKVHVMIEGSIVKSGDRSLLEEIDKQGYACYAKKD